LLELNLAEITEELIQKLSDDPVLLCDVVYALCKPQADQQNITDEQFGEAMAGDAIDAAVTALVEELVNFTRSPQRREMWRKVLDKQKQIEARGIRTIEEYISSDKLEAVLTEKLQAAINGVQASPDTTSSVTSTGLPG
jgi:hypothetical protein